MEKKRKELISNYSNLKREAEQKGVRAETIRQVFLNENKEHGSDTAKKHGSIKKLFRNTTDKPKWRTVCSTRNLLISFLVAGTFSAVFIYVFPGHVFNTLDNIFEIRTSRCAIENNGFFTEIARPLVQCSMCSSLTQVPVENNISAQDFLKKYAYTAVPVLIKNATTNWSAMETFSYDYLKEIYLSTDGALEAVEEECQFFPYKTEFKTLEDAFNISAERASFQEGEEPWYIGWSNCHSGIKDILRQHYQRPYFLSNGSESSPLDWIFMGGSGLGAFIHLDYVQRPSWQAQISGMKTWTLIPAPECESQCHSMNVTVHKGDIFVIDTNQWYHATYIHPGEISITIGSEYD